MLFKKIKSICDAKDMSIRELENKAGLGNGTIKGWEKSSPTVDNLKKVANILNCTIDELIRDGEGWNGMNIKEYKQIRDEAEEFSREILNKIPENFTLLHLECLGKIFPQVIENELIIQKSKAKPIINQSSLQK